MSSAKIRKEDWYSGKHCHECMSCGTLDINDIVDTMLKHRDKQISTADAVWELIKKLQ